MSLFPRRKGNKNFYYFSMGSGGQLYLGPEDKIHPERAKKALDYLLNATKPHSDIYVKLLSFLSPEERDEYILKWASILSGVDTSKTQIATRTLQEKASKKLAEYQKVKTELKILANEINCALRNL